MKNRGIIIEKKGKKKDMGCSFEIILWTRFTLSKAKLYIVYKIIVECNHVRIVLLEKLDVKASLSTLFSI